MEATNGSFFLREGCMRRGLIVSPWGLHLQVNPGNSVVAFKDNSSAIRGYTVNPLQPFRVRTGLPIVLPCV